MLVAASLVALLALAAFAVWQERNSLFDERRNLLRTQVETAIGHLQGLEAQVTAGQLSEDAAKAIAVAQLSKTRYNGKEYFFANSPDGKTVAHANEKLIGKDLSETKDPNGVYFIKELMQVARQSGGGFVAYHWKRGEAELASPKLNYAAVGPFGWMVGTGAFVDDIDAAVRSYAIKLIGIVGIVALILTAVAYTLGRGILASIGGEPGDAVELAASVAAGDLTRTIAAKPGSLLASLAIMQQQLREVFGKVISSAEEIARRSESVLAASREIGDAAHRQAESTAASAADIEELTVSISEVSQIAKLTEASSAKVTEISEKGAGLVNSAAAEISAVRATVTASTAQIRLLQERSQEVGGIADVIRKIADQTNLLALNAAIEAARAGEHGRGFAVVADEVRKLAERTSAATTEISRMVDAIQSETRQAVAGMEQTGPQVDSSMVMAQQASALLVEIHSQTVDSLARAREVANATAQQVTTASDIARLVEHMSGMAEEANAAMHTNADAAFELDRIATSLREQVSRFRV
jgi:methyl-accepting chemotaxis protein